MTGLDWDALDTTWDAEFASFRERWSGPEWLDRRHVSDQTRWFADARIRERVISSRESHHAWL